MAGSRSPSSAQLRGVSLAGLLCPNSPHIAFPWDALGGPALESPLGHSRQLLQPRETGIWHQSGTDLAHLAPQPGKCRSDSGWVCPLITFPPLFRVLQVTAAALGFDAGCSHGNGAGSGFVLTHPGTLLALTNCIFNRSLYWVFEVYVL